MNNSTELKIIASFKLYFPALVIEQNGARTLQTRDGGRGAWRSANNSELKLIFEVSSRALNLLVEGASK